MARARFLELWRCAGVDQDATPTGVVVPLGGSTTVVLETNGINLAFASRDPRIRIEAFDGKVERAFVAAFDAMLHLPGIDPQFRAAFQPVTTGWRAPKFFRIHGRRALGFPGLRLAAVPVRVPGTRPAHQGDALQVVVLPRLDVPIAIRPVLVRGAQGGIVPMANPPLDLQQELANMNQVWGAQAQIRFTLVSDAPVVIDHDDPATQVALRKAYGQKESTSPQFGLAAQEFRAERHWDLFAPFAVAGAVMTFFVVRQLYSRDGTANGVMQRERGLCFIDGKHREITTMAHEAGHYLGRMGHVYDTDPQRGLRLLMRDGGAGWKVPFSLAETCRKGAEAAIKAMKAGASGATGAAGAAGATGAGRPAIPKAR